MNVCSPGAAGAFSGSAHAVNRSEGGEILPPLSALMNEVEQTSLMTAFWRDWELNNSPKPLIWDEPAGLLVKKLMAQDFRDGLLRSKFLGTAVDTLAVRTRFIDDFLRRICAHETLHENGLSNGCQTQRTIIVNLGAGMDSRPYRLDLNAHVSRKVEKKGRRTKYIEVERERRVLDTKHNFFKAENLPLMPDTAVAVVEADVTSAEVAELIAAKILEADDPGDAQPGTDPCTKMDRAREEGEVGSEYMTIAWLYEGLLEYIPGDRHETLWGLPARVAELLKTEDFKVKNVLIGQNLEPSFQEHAESLLDNPLPWRDLRSSEEMAQLMQMDCEIFRHGDFHRLYGRAPHHGFNLLVAGERVEKI